MSEFWMVRSNPGCAKGPNGVDAGAVPMEGTRDCYVGARVDVEESVRARKVRFVFDSTPVRVPRTAYYRRKLMDAELLPADEATANAVGVTFSTESP